MSGGAAVAIYTNNRYLTKDLDFVTSARRDALRKVLEPLGFTDAGDGRHFEHEPSGWLLEFPPGPVSFGDTSLSETDIPIIDCEFGRLRVITATQSLMDRLAAYFHWNRQPELRRQVRQLIATMDPKGAVDWEDLYAWDVPSGAMTQLTHEPKGRVSAVLGPDGRHAYFLKDTDGNELGPPTSSSTRPAFTSSHRRSPPTARWWWSAAASASRHPASACWPSMPAEDFGNFWRADNSIQTMFFWVGGVPQGQWDAAQAGGAPVPSAHSPFWAPDAEAVVATASEALATLGMEILKPAG